MRKLLLDTNMLVLFLVGNKDRKMIGQARNLREFSVDDLEFVNKFATETAWHLSLPNILTETSNLIRQIGSFNWSPILKQYIQFLDEIYLPSQIVAEQIHFHLLGLTDAAILKLSIEQKASGHQIIVLTKDWDLHGKLLGEGVEAANPLHFRTPHRV